MENLTPKIDDALGAVMELLELKQKRNCYYETQYGKKSEMGVKLSIISKLREYGIVLSEDASV